MNDPTQSYEAPGAEHRGVIVAIGGAEDKQRSRQILRRVLELAGGEQARMVVIPTASRMHDTGQRYCRLFKEMGAADSTEIVISKRQDCEQPRLVQAVERATGVFLTGGNQLRLSSLLGGTALARTLRHRHAAGALVAGTSAGASFISEHMIAYGREGSTPRAGMVSLVPGLGLVNTVIIDQHFRQRDRLGRLLTALAYNPYQLGLGLDEDTAALIHPDGAIEVLGTNAVTILDASELAHSSIGYTRAGQPVSMTGLRLHVLVDGGWYDLRSRSAHPHRGRAEELDEEDLEAVDADVRGVPEDEVDESTEDEEITTDPPPRRPAVRPRPRHREDPVPLDRRREDTAEQVRARMREQGALPPETAPEEPEGSE